MKETITTFIFLAIITLALFLIIFINNKMMGSLLKPGEIESELEAETVDYVRPGQILANKAKYNNQFLIIQGRVVKEEVVCERKECSQDDPCCGCKNTRDLTIIDPGMSSALRPSGKLLLLSSGKESFCQRKLKSCDYDCSDWKENGVYELRGVFRATPPPIGSGLKIYFEHYFEVQDKSLIASLGLFDRAKSLFNDLKNLVKSTKTSGYYILR